MYRQMTSRGELRKGSEGGSERVGLAPDAQKGKGTKERGYETGRVTGRLVFDRRSGVAWLSL